MADKSAIIIGAGFSGLSTAAILAASGFLVEVFEKNDQAGGRARVLKKNGYTFDMGPSWYWMPDVFESFYSRFGYTAGDFYNLKKLSPSFRIFYSSEDVMDMPAPGEEIFSLFENIERGAAKQLRKFLKDAEEKYRISIHEKIVFKPSISWREYISYGLLARARKLSLLTPFHQHVRNYFDHPKLIQLMEFPVLFLGAMPEQTPSLFSLMNYAGMMLGTWYPQGGMNKIVEAIEKIAKQNGAVIHLKSEVKKIHTHRNRVSAVEAGDELFYPKAVIASADYHHVEEQLLPKEQRQYTEKYWNSRVMSPSALCFYIGVKKKLKGLLHHNLFFDADFDAHAEEIYRRPSQPTDPLFYLCCPSKTDDSVAPAGCENLFVLIPIAAGINDSEAMREKYFQLVVERIQRITGNDFENEIEFKQSYCIKDFDKDYHAFKGNAYGLANTFLQTAFMRPRMQHRTLKNLFYAGQLTVPGPGVPPAIISGQIAADLVKDFLNSTNDEGNF